MIVKYKPARRREYVGTYRAELVNVDLEPNSYYDPTENPDAAEHTLTITFQVDDNESEETFMFTQKFVYPTTDDGKLFDQLLTALGELPDKDGGELDVNSFLGLNLLIEFDKNNKGYAYVKSVQKADDEPKKKAVESDEVKLPEGI